MARLGCAAPRALSASLSSAKVASVLVFGDAGLRRSTAGAVALAEGAGLGVGALAQAARVKYAAIQIERAKFAVMLLLIGKDRSQALF